MRKKLLLLFTLLVMLLDMGMSSCTMRTVSGNPHVWQPTGRTSRHWGARGHYNQRRALWGKHRYGPRPHDQRGRYH